MKKRIEVEITDLEWDALVKLAKEGGVSIEEYATQSVKIFLAQGVNTPTAHKVA